MFRLELLIHTKLCLEHMRQTACSGSLYNNSVKLPYETNHLNAEIMPCSLLYPNLPQLAAIYKNDLSQVIQLIESSSEDSEELCETLLA